MTTNSVSTDHVQLADVRAILAEDYSATTINRIVMAIKTHRPSVSFNTLSDLRSLLAEDFPAKKINRVIMSLKCFCMKAYQ